MLSPALVAPCQVRRTTLADLADASIARLGRHIATPNQLPLYIGELQFRLNHLQVKDPAGLRYLELLRRAVPTALTAEQLFDLISV